jgi:predicted RNase H-like HicB family nuclease
MKKNFDVVIERDSQGYFIASVPALPGCHTQARSLDKLQTRIQEAIVLCLEAYGSQTSPSEFVSIQRVAVDA